MAKGRSILSLHQKLGERVYMSTLARKIIFSSLKNIEGGQLIFREKNHVWHFGQSERDPLNSATIEIHNKNFYNRVLLGGGVGLAESYVAGDWSTDDLTKVLRVLARNQKSVSAVDKGFLKIQTVLRWVTHQFKRNTVSGSRKNIAAHYDLSNEFFSLFLDKTWMYSCAVFPTSDTTLEEASIHKLDKICQKLSLKPGQKIVEIGTGWGGFALHAAEHYGCDIVTTTISKKQYELARERIREKKLESKITLLQEDYRKLTGEYDKLVSIEMIEAVGYQYYDAFFKTCGRLLKPDGQMLLQAITIEDQSYEKAKDNVDFIKRHIFPGTCIPSVTALLKSITKSSDLRLFNLEDIGVHYAKTLASWRDNFLSNKNSIYGLGFDDHTVRLWEFYFSYCEAGFSEGYISDVQMLCLKPDALGVKAC